MAVAVVQTAANSSTTTNPTLKYASRPALNDFLLAYSLQQSATMPGTPTDTAGNVWQPMAPTSRPADSIAPSGLSACVYRVPKAKLANTTVTFPTVAPSCFAIQEFSGVLADQNVGTDNESDQPDRTSCGFAGPTADFFVGLSPSSASEYVQALVVCLDQTVTWTLDTTGQFSGWTLDRAFAGGGLSVALAHQVASSLVIAHFIASKPVVACVIGTALAHV